MAAHGDHFVQLVMQDSSKPVAVEIRLAMASINERKIAVVSARVDNLLAQHPGSFDKPASFNDLVARIGKAFAEHPKQKQEDDTLAQELMGLSSLDAPMPNGEAAAWGLVTGYQPDYDNIFYHPDSSFKSALGLVHEILSFGLARAKEWANMPLEPLRMSVHKMRNSEEHPICRLAKDVDHVRKFLQHGREGWPMMHIPHHFFNAVMPVLEEFSDILFRLSNAHEDLRSLGPKFLDPGLRMLKVLRYLKQVRIAEEKAEMMREIDERARIVWEKREEDMHPKRKVDGMLALMEKAELEGDRDGDVSMR